MLVGGRVGATPPVVTCNTSRLQSDDQTAQQALMPSRASRAMASRGAWTLASLSK
jgi:hypothetical protein